MLIQCPNCKSTATDRVEEVWEKAHGETHRDKEFTKLLQTVAPPKHPDSIELWFVGVVGLAVIYGVMRPVARNPLNPNLKIVLVLLIVSIIAFFWHHSRVKASLFAVKWSEWLDSKYCRECKQVFLSRVPLEPYSKE